MNPKSSSAIWVVTAILLVLVTVVGAVVFTLTLPPAEAASTNVAVIPTTKSSDEPAPTRAWVMEEVQEGATLLSPGPVKKRAVTVAGESGTCHSAAEGNTIAEVFVFDLKNDRRADREEFLSKVLGVSAERVSIHSLRPIPGGDATEYTASDVSGFDHAGLVIGRGGRWFVFHIAWKPEDDPKERRRSQFISRAGVTWLRPDRPTDLPKGLKPVDRKSKNDPPKVLRPR